MIHSAASLYTCTLSQSDSHIALMPATQTDLMPDSDQSQDDKSQRLAWRLGSDIQHSCYPARKQQHNGTVKQRSILVSDALQINALKTQEVSHLLVSHVQTLQIRAALGILVQEPELLRNP